MAEIDTGKVIASQFKCTVQVMLLLMDLVPRQGLIFELKFLGVVGTPVSYHLVHLGKRTDASSRPAQVTK